MVFICLSLAKFEHFFYERYCPGFWPPQVGRPADPGFMKGCECVCVCVGGGGGGGRGCPTYLCNSQ